MVNAAAKRCTLPPVVVRIRYRPSTSCPALRGRWTIGRWTIGSGTRGGSAQRCIRGGARRLSFGRSFAFRRFRRAGRRRGSSCTSISTRSTRASSSSRGSRSGQSDEPAARSSGRRTHLSRLSPRCAWSRGVPRNNKLRSASAPRDRTGSGLAGRSAFGGPHGR